MKILIYGSGAVGLGLASCLIKAGAEVDILGRSQTILLLKEKGFSRDGIFGTFNASPDQFICYSSLYELIGKTYDYILVCVKSFDSRDAAMELSSVKSILGKNGVIVLCQNGWGNAQIFYCFFDQHRIFNARIITGFTRLNQNHVTITVHADSIHMGCLFHGSISILNPLCDILERGGIGAVVVDSVEKDLWAKMLYNCALNPLGAVFNVAYGVLGDHGSARAIMNLIIEEIFVVMKAAGYSTHWKEPSQYLEIFYSKLIPSTKEHKSSTLQDIVNGRKTEIDFLNGAVIKLGRQHNILTPANSIAYNMVTFVTEHKDEKEKSTLG